MVTASATTQSRATGDFLALHERPRIGGHLYAEWFVETASLRFWGHYCVLFSGPKIPFPETDTLARRRLVRL